MDISTIARTAALATLLAAVCLTAPAGAQIGARTMTNARSFNLDAGTIGDRLGISSSDTTTKKMELTREIQYWDPQRWQPSSVTWLRFDQVEGGDVVVTEMGAGVVREVAGPKDWTIVEIEPGRWTVTPKKAGGKLDLYLETVFQGKPFKVGAVVPKFDGPAYGAVYRGVDFLFFVVQKKAPADGVASPG